MTFVITIAGAALAHCHSAGRPPHGSYLPVLAAGAALCASAIVANLVVDRKAML